MPPSNHHDGQWRAAEAARFDGGIETTWSNMRDPGAFAVAGAEEQEGELPPLAGAGVIVCLTG